jgi:hypothetical protein
MSVWDDEPKEEAFVESGLYCLMRRNHVGVWAGYVGVTGDHALARQRRDVLIVLPDSFATRALDSRRIAIADMPVIPDRIAAGMTVPASVAIDVHGGVMFTGMLSNPDEPYWYIGFDCGQPWDYKPADPMTRSARETMDPKQHEALFRTAADYRTIDYARAETEALAAQIAGFAGVTVAGVSDRAKAFAVPPARRDDGLRV